MQRSRQSVYPGPPPSNYWSTLDSCSISLDRAGSSLANATQTLQQGTFDFARLSKVVQSRRCFELITETELQSAQRAMSNEMEPQIKELIARAEDGIEVLKKREKSLKAKVEARQVAPEPAVAAVPKTGPRSIAALEEKLAALRRQKAGLITELEGL